MVKQKSADYKLSAVLYYINNDVSYTKVVKKEELKKFYETSSIFMMKRYQDYVCLTKIREVLQISYG